VFVRDERLEVERFLTSWFAEVHDRPGARLPGARVPRTCAIVRLRDRASDTVFDVMNAHLDERSSERRTASVTMMIGWIDPAVPTVVLGDFNAEPSEAELAPLLAAGLRFAIPESGGPTAHGVKGEGHGRRLDHILVTDHWDVVDGRVVRSAPNGRLPSDHWPIAADLHLR
jgi:endonuclease/exonuclease/phosphatase family metal-dependent hydrolase